MQRSQPSTLEARRQAAPRPAGPALLAAALIASWVGVHGDLAALWQGLPALGRLLAGLWPPALEPDFLAVVAHALGETISLSLLGMVLAIALGTPLAFLATGRIGGEPVGRVRYTIGRSILDVLRAIPDLVWALLFVVIAGLGMVPGVLALGLSYAGMLGKLYAEILEGMDPRPIEALRATGAGRLVTFLYGAVPPAWPQIVNFTLYAWECAMRSAAVMGFVGAGGLGYQLDLSLRMFAYHEVATLLLALIALVAAADGVGMLARRALLPDARHRTPAARRALRVAGIFAAVAAIAGALAMLAAPLSAVLTPAGAARLARFLHGAFPPDLSRAFLGQVGVATLETLAIALLGTALGLVIGGALAYMATHNLFLHQLGDGRVPPARRAAYMAARWSLDVLRALPEVPLAVFLILAVGLGPFAGTLALGLHTAGVLGRLIADTLEAAERQAFLAVRAAGAGPLVATLYTAVPASASVLVAHTIYRWEMNVRASAVLGVVGAGGLGQALYTNLQLGFYDRLVTLLMVLFVLVTLGDRLGTLLRASWRRP